MVAVQDDGLVLPKDRFPFTRLSIQDETVMGEGGVHSLKMSFRLHPEQQPKAIDMQSKGYHNEIYNAIYALDGDTLTICRPYHDDDRPVEFASKPGSRILLYTARRIPPSHP